MSFQKILDNSLVLVVDDDSIIRMQLRGILGKRYMVMDADSGEAAFDFLNNIGKPDIILLDINMPGMDGFEVMKKLRENEKWKEIPVIVMASDTSEDIELESLTGGAVDFINKPIRADIIIERISRTLKGTIQKKELEIEVREIKNIAQQNKDKAETLMKDLVSGLYNRISGEEYINAALKKRGGHIAFLDLDHLKKVNDVLGHEKGDYCILQTGKILNNLGENVISCRYGGDEFLLFLIGMDMERAGNIMDEIYSELSSLSDMDDVLSMISFSVGLCEVKKGDYLEDVLKLADKALYHVKQSGKNYYYFYRDLEKAGDNDYSDINSIIESVKADARVVGPMSIEYREFSKVYVFAEHIQERCGIQFVMSLMTINKNTDAINTEISNEVVGVLENIIKSFIRGQDIYVRYGNHKYLILFTNVTTDNVHNIMERIRNEFLKRISRPSINLTYEIAPIPTKDDM